VITLKTIDAHAAGAPLRLIVDGFPAPRGKTLADKRDWALRHADHLRRVVMLEPRGHRDMCGAVFTEPASPGSHAGVLFMYGDGFGWISGHGIIAATTIALERGIIVPGGDARSLTLDTPAGTVRAAVEWSQEPRKVQRVTFVNVPSFVLHGGVEIAAGPRRVRADIAFGGEFYAIVDGESVGLPIDGAHVPELRRVGMEIVEAINRTLTIVHPTEPRLVGISGTIFTGPPHSSSADLRNVTVFADGVIDRSPCATGTAAVMTVIDAMGLLDDQRPFVHESILGTTFSGRVASRTMVGEYRAMVPEIQGSAWITGEHAFVADVDDPLAHGFIL
jgi:proline racemase